MNSLGVVSVAFVGFLHLQVSEGEASSCQFFLGGSGEVDLSGLSLHLFRLNLTLLM